MNSEASEASASGFYPEIDPMRIPEDLRKKKQWVNWRLEPIRGSGGQLVMVPCTPWTSRKANLYAPVTWDSFDSAYEWCARGEVPGVGFVLTPPFAGVAIDESLRSFLPHEWARPLIEGLDGYAEFNYNGGINMIMRGAVPAGAPHTKFGVGPSGHGIIRVCGPGHFLGVTGWHLPGTPTTVNNCEEQLGRLRDMLFQNTEDVQWEEVLRGF